ncbi:MAG: hypothetical protein DHS20C16_01150 [Phycisphaerae bacterium]|nr:MAG: hypothetical protein DHS20C16_01150 [Phycisphaerae bacterium]
MKNTTLQRYHESFADTLGGNAAFAFWKGRVALYAILRAMGIKEGDEVIMPGYTCVMAVNPIIYLGAKPVFVDIDPDTYNMDPNQIESKISARTRMIIAQHTYGIPADMDAILDIGKRKSISVIEDCCLSMGSTIRGKKTGTFGEAAYFSFQWNKPYTSGLGGMALTCNENLAQRIGDLWENATVEPSFKQVNLLRLQLMVYRSLIYPKTTALAQETFRTLNKWGLVVGSSQGSELTPKMEPDFFKRMSTMQARAGLRQLDRVAANLTHRRKMREIYDRLCCENGLALPKISPDADPVLVRYPVRVADKATALRKASSHFVELGSWFECPLHPIETPMSAYGYHEGMCPEADKACREVVNLPCHPRASESTAKRSVAFLGKISDAK